MNTRALVCRIMPCMMAVMSLAMTRYALAATAPSGSFSCAVSSVNYWHNLDGVGTNFTLVTPPSHGTLNIYVPGSGYTPWTNTAITTYSYIQYTPTPLYIGPDSFVWQTTDGAGTSPNATCSITVTTNSVPQANPQSLITVVGAGRAYLYLNSTHQDYDQSVTWQLVTAPTNGTLEYYADYRDYLPVPTGMPISDCSWYYTPNASISGSDSFTWNMSDGISTSGPATCSITITVNHPPVARDQALICSESSGSRPLSLSYTEVDGNQSHTFTILTVPAHGVLRDSSMNTMTAGSVMIENNYCYYTPALNYRGNDGFTWNVSDGADTSATATVSITVETNHPPVVTTVAQSLSCLKNSTNDLSPFLAYTHTDVGQTLTFTLVTAPTNGTLVNSGSPLGTGSTSLNNGWVYIPALNFTGADGFVWSVGDGIGSTTGTVAISVAPRVTPTPPMFKSGVKVMDGAKPLALGTRVVNGKYDFAGPVYYSDGPRNNNMVVAAPELVDWNNDGLVDLLVGQADGRIALFINKGSKGNPVFNGYQYVQLSTGRDIRTYLGGCVCQGGGPECAAPRVVDWNNDGRKDLILGQWSGPSYGMNLFVYLNVGTDKAPVFDRKLACSMSSPSGYPTTMPFVTDWNSDGISDLISGDNPVWKTGGPNGLINIFMGTSNNHGPAIVYSGNCWNYELFNWDEYKPTGSFKTTSPTLTTSNACPVASRKSVVPADWDGSGKKDLISGLQDGTVWYSPNVGTRNFPAYTNCYRLQAGGSNIVVGTVAKVGQDPVYGTQGNMLRQESLPAVNEARLAIGDLDGDGLLDLVAGDITGSITVFYQYNPNPVAIDQRVLVLPDTPKLLSLSSKVDSGHGVTYSILDYPTNGILSGSAPNLSYLPNAGFTGRDRFTFVTTEGSVTSRVATISLTVGPHKPVAQWTSPATLTATAVLNMNKSINLVLTATDAGTEPLTYSIVTPPSHGTWSLSSNVFTYTPWPDYSGPDRFAYKVNDGYQDSNPALVNLDVCVLAVNFQRQTNSVPEGYQADTGAVFNAAQGYGWEVPMTSATYSRGRTPDPRLDSFVYSTNAAAWTCTLPNGEYLVSLTVGDPSAAQGPQQVVVNGISAVSSVTTLATALSYLAGNVPVTVTNGQLTVVISGAGCKTSLAYLEIRCVYQPMGAATFVTEDVTTQGSWKGKYGTDGYKMITGLLSPRGADGQVDYVVNSYYDYELLQTPSYAVISGPPNGIWGAAKWKTWAFPTADRRALDYPAPMLDDSRMAVAWYAANAGSTISCDINFTDGQTHRVAVYCLAWGNSSWVQRMEVLDAGDGSVLDSMLVSNFGGGKWLVWDLKGHVQIRATCISGAVAVSGFFFGTYAPPSISEQPLDAAAQTGQSATFSISASGHPLSYQWQRSSDGWWWDDIPGANAESYSLVTEPGDDCSEFRCVVMNSYGYDVSSSAWLTVNESLPLPPVITSPLIVTCVYDEPFSYTVTAINNPTYFDAYMPPMAGSYDGIDMGTGVITFSNPAYWNGYNTSWTDGPGTLYIPIFAGNAGGEDFAILTLIINPTNAPVVTSPLSAIGRVGVPFSYTITATPAATLYSTWDLPAWLSLNTGTGVITGTPPPEATGSMNVTLRAGNANGTGMAELEITILGMPAIVKHPVDASAPLGEPATFSVATIGTAPLFHQWMNNGANIIDATNISYTIPAVSYDLAGPYSVMVSNTYGGVTSRTATLTVTAGLVAPAISIQPANLLVAVAQPALLTVVATGTSPLTYQWMKGGTNIVGATDASYRIPAATMEDGGSYSVTITNSVGSVTSSNVWLTVNNCLAAWWKLDETSGTSVADASGNNRTGTLQVTASWTNAGQIGGALQLNGVNDRFSVTPAVPLGSNDWTITAWFMAPLPNTATWHNLVRAASGGDYLITADSTLNLGMFDTQTGGGFRSCGYNMGSLPSGWHHVAAIGSGNTTQFFIDGIPVGNSDRKGGKDVPAVGNYSSGGQRFANSIDDVRLYTRTLTADEILLLSSVPPTIKGQPVNQTVVAGNEATFSVTAAGSGPLFYQWLQNGQSLYFEFGSSLSVPYAFPYENGDQYQVIVSNAGGSITSTVATLFVTNCAPAVSVQAAATPNIMTGSNTVLSVGAADDGGSLNLTYTWITNGTAPGAVSYSRNGNNSSRTTTVTFGTPGIYNFIVIIEDDWGLTTTSMVAVTVVQTVPMATSQAVTTMEDTARMITLTGTSPENAALTYFIASDPLHGTLGALEGATVTYTPATDYVGPDSFTFYVSDGVAPSAEAVVSITVSAVNDPPVARNQSLAIVQNTTRGVTLSATDPDGDALAYTLVAGPLHGSLGTLTGSNVTYTPASTFTGQDAFTFQATDPSSASNRAVITVTVSSTVLAENFESGWADNAKVNTTNGWVSGAEDLSIVTNPAAGYSPLPGGMPFPMSYDHATGRRLLRFDTEQAVLSAPRSGADFNGAKVYLDMMINFDIRESIPSPVLTNVNIKTVVFLKSADSSTNLCIFHGNKAGAGFGAPSMTVVTNSVLPNTWYRLTIMLDATAGAEAFRVLINGVAVNSSTDAYSDDWKTVALTPPYTPDGGAWFLSAARREGSVGANPSQLAGVDFGGKGFIDDLVITYDQPLFSAGFFRITQFIGLHGDAVPAGRITIPAGGSTTIVYRADPWYRIAGISNDAVAMAGAAGATAYTNSFTNVVADHDVQATFSAASAAQAGIPETVDPAWAHQYFPTEAAALNDLNLDTDYLLGLNPTNAYEIGFSFVALSAGGGSITSIVQLKDGPVPLQTQIHGVLKLQGKATLFDTWNDVGSAFISNALFGADGRCAIHFTDTTNKFYKALIAP